MKIDRRKLTCRHDDFEERFNNVLKGLENFIIQNKNEALEYLDDFQKKMNKSNDEYNIVLKLDLEKYIDAFCYAGLSDFADNLLRLIEKYRK